MQFCPFMNSTVPSAKIKLRNCAAALYKVYAAHLVEKILKKCCLFFGQAEVLQEAEPPPQIAEGEQKPTAAVAEPL